MAPEREGNLAGDSLLLSWAQKKPVRCLPVRPAMVSPGVVPVRREAAVVLGGAGWAVGAGRKIAADRSYGRWARAVSGPRRAEPEVVRAVRCGGSGEMSSHRSPLTQLVPVALPGPALVG
ncbi:hypothetical protein Ari01nite_94550 [Paractinoplanes rishiriensis]|uniref:Uncharacterized protein n=1 Tax=Paractinoplanes rishiriensis TaxID=1050105 RepID=A0A919N1P4_9ACTN|nr:hypothetical protein Ari01nite_94550 [Actinoplanes rishiriensis]